MAVFLFGDDNMDKYVAYTDDEITWISASIASGVSANNVVTVILHLSVYHSKLYNHNEGS